MCDMALCIFRSLINVLTFLAFKVLFAGPMCESWYLDGSPEGSHNLFFSAGCWFVQVDVIQHVGGHGHWACARAGNM